jgi:hypothetical protein
MLTIGDRVVVYGWELEVRVIDVSWSGEKNGWQFTLDWVGFGRSIVFDHDENVVWYKYETTN